MKIYLKDSKFTVYIKDFPMTVFELQDTLDQMKIPQSNPNVQFRISEYDNTSLPKDLCSKEFSADIYKINLFAERYEKLDEPNCAAFKSLLEANSENSFEDMLLMTYGLDSVPVYPCSSLEELGEAMIENDMVEELNELPDEYMDLIDREKIGRLCKDRENGIFIDGYYCVPSSYEPPDINIKIGEPDKKCFFRLLIAPAPIDKEPTDKLAQWISLPCEREQLDEIAKTFGADRIEDMVYYDFQSALPMITDKQFGDIKLIDELNFLAHELSKLTEYNFVKLKAIMELEDKHEIYDAYYCLRDINKYDFDVHISDMSEFGREYLSRNLPTDFDLSVLDDVDLYDLGGKILKCKGTLSTSYGLIYGKDQDLYSAITVQQEHALSKECEEELTEDESQDFNMGMEMGI